MKPRIPLPPHLVREPFTHKEGLEAGLGKSRLTGGDLVAPFHGVKVSTTQPLDLRARCRAFMKRMPPAAFFNSLTAAQLMSVPLPRMLEQSSLLHVAVPYPARASTARGVVGHSVHLLGDDVQLVAGIPTSSPARAWCELGAILSLADLVAAGDYLLHWRHPLITPLALRRASEAFPGRHGAKNRRRALTLVNDRAESPQESRLRVVLTTAGIQGLAVNLDITIGQRRFRLDLALPELQIAIEYEGDYHRDSAQWRKDMTRESVLASAGWMTVHLNADDLRDPRELADRIRRIVRSRAAHP